MGGRRSVSARPKWVVKLLWCMGEWAQAFWVGFTWEGLKGPFRGSFLGEQSRMVPAERHQENLSGPLSLSSSGLQGPGEQD